jgi:hypothetical protein
MKGKWISILVLGTLALLLCAQATAQQEGKPSDLYPKVQIVNIEQDIIDAGPETPEISSIAVTRRIPLKSLIRIRESFGERVLACAKDL